MTANSKPEDSIPSVAATPRPWRISFDGNGQANLYGADDHWIALFPHQCISSFEERMKVDSQTVLNAVTEYEKLKAQNERLAEALKKIRNTKQYSCECVEGDCSCDFRLMQFIAEEALSKEQGGGEK